MKKYRVPIDLIIAVDEEDNLEGIIRTISTLMYKDYYPYGLIDYEFPVGLPTEPYESTST